MNASFRLCLVFLGLACAAASLHAADDAATRRIITVTGQENVRIPATRARLTAMVEVQAKTSAAAQDAVRQGSQSVLEFLQRQKVERLQAGTMALQPIYNSDSGSYSSGARRAPEVVAYRAQWSASFETPAERAGEIADGLVKAGATRIASFEFTATDEALAQAQRDALRAAAVRAREDARSVLDALGYQPADVVRINANSSGPIMPFRRAEMMTYAKAQDSAATPVEPGLIEVNGSVTLEVAY